MLIYNQKETKETNKTKHMTGVKVIKTQRYLTTGYAVNRNVSIEMKIIQGVISRTMSHANHLAKETLFAIMLYSVKVSTQDFDSCNIGSNPTRAVAEITKRMNKVSGLKEESEKLREQKEKLMKEILKELF